MIFPFRHFALFCLILFSGLSLNAQNTFDEAMTVYDTGDYSKAVPLFTKAIEAKSEVAKALMHRADCYANLQQLKEAKQDLDASLKISRKTPELWYFFGRYHLFNSEAQLAKEAFTEAIKQDPKDDQSYDGRAIAKMLLQDFKGALEDDNQAIALYTKDHTFYNNRGFAKMQLKMLDEALEDFKSSISLEPNAKAYANMGSIYVMNERYAKAIDMFTQAINLKSYDPELLFYRGQCLETLGKYEEACTDYQGSREICTQIKYSIPQLSEAMKRINCL